MKLTETRDEARARIAVRFEELRTMERSLRSGCNQNNPLPYSKILPIWKERRGLKDEWEALNV